MFNLKSFSNNANPGVMPPSETSSSGSRNGRSAASNRGSENSNHSKSSKKKRSRRRRKPKNHSKVEPLNQSSPSPKKQHDAPMTKRDLYFSLACEVVLVGDEANAATSVHELSVARVTILNYDEEVVLDTFIKVAGQIIDSMGTGVTTDDIQSNNPRAMDYSTVRHTVERILCGKILVGYKLKENLAALGLSHPSTDVRDVLFYCGSVEEELRSIDELAEAVLQRSLPDFDERHRSIEVCIAALDLYKAKRKEWEMNLIAKSRQNEMKTKRDNHLTPVTNRQQNAYPSRHGPPQQPHNVIYPMQQDPRGTMPVNYLPPMASHPWAYTSPHNQNQQIQRQHQHQQPVMMMAGQTLEARQQATRNNSSWFSIGRRPRYPQQPPPGPVASPAPQASLSSHALEALSYPSSSSFDYFDGSSAYDGSTGYDRSTDYSSSRPYSESVDSFVSESVGSAVSESVGSVLSEPMELVNQDDGTNIPEGDHSAEENSGTTSSSWFRFGSRKSRYAHQQREPMTVVQESNEVEEPTTVAYEEMEREIVIEEVVPLNDEPLRSSRHGSGLPEEKKHSSSWFGFKRSKSPSSAKKDKLDYDSFEVPPEEVDPSTQNESPVSDSENAPLVESTAENMDATISEKQSSWFIFGKKEKLDDPVGIPEEIDQSVHDETTATDPGNAPPVEPTTEKADTTITDKQSSWFKFGLRSSGRSKSPLRAAESPLQQDGLPHDEIITLRTQESSQASDEDWWQEVMNKSGDQDMQTSEEEKWMENHPTGSAAEGLVQSGSKSSTRFRFLRSTKSSVPETGFPLESKKEETGGCSEQQSQPLDGGSGGNEEWLSHSSAQPFDPSCLGPAWFGPDKQQQQQQQPDAESTESTSLNLSSQLKETAYSGLLHQPRSRVLTESTVPSVSTGEPHEDDDDSFSREFVQGMEKNFSFLNI